MRTLGLISGLSASLALALVSSVTLGAAPPAPVPGTWVNAGSTPMAAYETASVVLHDGHVLVPPQGLYDPVAGTWNSPTCAPVSSRCPARPNHPHRDSRALALIDGPNCGAVCGDALWVGGHPQFVGSGYEFNAERYHPADGTWTSVARAHFPHGPGATATLLTGGPADCGANCGRILVAGGVGNTGCGGDCATGQPELYDPALDQWIPAIQGALLSRVYGTATPLSDGKVFVAGGQAATPDGSLGDYTNETEIFDPLTTSWHPGRPMLFVRAKHTATLLQSGKVLIAGGQGCRSTTPGISACAQQTFSALNSTELYDPPGLTSSYCPTAPTAACPGAMINTHPGDAAAPLPSGGVVVTGEPSGPAPEVYNPAAGTWRPTGTAVGPSRSLPSAVLMNCNALVGRVLVAGGGAIGNTVYEADAWDGVPTVDSVTGSDGSDKGILIGPMDGGTTITVKGRWLRGTSVRLLVGGVDTTQVAVNSAGTQVTGVTAAGALGGPLPIQLLLDGAPADMCGSHLFTYLRQVPQPTVGSAVPNCGALSTPTSVVIPGSYLNAPVSVQFGTSTPRPATVGPGVGHWTATLHVLSPLYTVPTTVPVPVTVITNGGTVKLPAGTFTVPCPVTAPMLSSVTPLCGPPGTPVTLTGQNFNPPIQVSFGGSVVPGTPDPLLQSVTAVAPSHANGPVSVTIPGPPPSNPVQFDYEQTCSPSNAAVIASLQHAESGQTPSGSSAGDTHAGPYLPAPPAGPPPAPAPAPVPVQAPGAVVMPQLAPNPGMAGVPQLRQQTEKAAPETSHGMVRTGDAEGMAVGTCAGAVATGGLFCGMIAAQRRSARRACRPAPRWAC